jgi:hypothetical protein
VRFGKRRLVVKSLVCADRVSLVRPLVENHLLPELVHDRQMFIPIYPGYIVEEKTDRLILSHPFIKAIYQELYVCQSFYILQHNSKLKTNHLPEA